MTFNEDARIPPTNINTLNPTIADFTFNMEVEEHPEIVVDGKYIPTYGVCDDPRNFYDVFGEALTKSGRRFMVNFSMVFKGHQPEKGGWRWHKWGPCIGKLRPTTEYLYDEPDIDAVMLFTVYEATISDEAANVARDEEGP